MLVSALLTGIVLGGTYALMGIGLTIQYGVARVMNLAYGDLMIVAALATFVLFTGLGVAPIWGLFLIVPGGFALSYVLYIFLLRPLARRAHGGERMTIDSILVTFGLLFVIQGIALVYFGGNYVSYAYMVFPIEVLGTPLAANRMLALGLAVSFAGLIYLALNRTRWGTALRAVSVAPRSAPLVGINVDRAAAMAFAIGGAVAAAGGVAVSIFLTFSATVGITFTLKALIVVIMGGVGNLMGALVAGLLLGLVETIVATFVAPDLTLAATFLIFLTVLMVKPAGLFGRSA